MKIFSALAFSALASAAAIDAGSSKHGAKALYFMSNRNHGNQIHALPVGRNGLIQHHGREIATGGLGGRQPSAPGAVPDALSSQGSLALAGNYLYAVNAGSNTISVLSIDPNDLLNVTLVGDPIPTYGDFPVSVAVHAATRRACVANSGKKSGIACYTVADNGRLIHDTSAFYPLTLSPQQTNPPSGPFNTVSQVFFNKAGTALYATVKGVPKNSTGYFAYFPIDKKTGVVSTKQVRSSPNGTAVLFGSVSLPKDRVFATDASFGAALLQIDGGGKASIVKKTNIVNNAATCWSAYSEYTDLLYTTDDGNNQVVSFNPRSGEQVKISVLKNKNSQMIEVLAAGEMLYALAHGNYTYPQHVVAMKASKDGDVTSVQNFQLPASNINVEGLVAWTK